MVRLTCRTVVQQHGGPQFASSSSQLRQLGGNNTSSFDSLPDTSAPPAATAMGGETASDGTQRSATEILLPAGIS